MMALGVSNEDADAKLNALNNAEAKDRWAAAVAILDAFFRRGVQEAMRATSDWHFAWSYLLRNASLIDSWT